jgi:hypothetical protein
LLGRYAKPGRGTAVLEADLPDGRRARWALPLELPARGKTRDVERLWAQASADEVLDALAVRSLERFRRAELEKELARVSLEGQILTPATSLLVLESEAMFRDHGIERRNRDRVEADRAAEAQRREDAERLVEARRLEAATQGELAMAAPRESSIWPRRGGGAGEPVFLLLALAALAWRGGGNRRRA